MVRGKALVWFCVLAAGAASVAAEPSTSSDLSLRLDRVEAIKAIERLQSVYGYYQDRYLFDQPPTLFTRDKPSVHYNGGIWEGSKGIERLWLGYFRTTLAQGAKGPVAGQLYDQPQMQGVVTVADDGRTATATFRTLGRRVAYGKSEEWIAGIYHNDYVKEDGVWKFKTLRYCTRWSAPYTQGWKDAQPVAHERWQLYPQSKHGPNRVERDPDRCRPGYPQLEENELAFVHPVTGQTLREIAAKGAQP